VYGHGSGHFQLSFPAPGINIPKSIVVPSANVTVPPLNARACGSFAGHPEIVIVVPGFSRSL
jgi:hypothetical protein